MEKEKNKIYRKFYRYIYTAHLKGLITHKEFIRLDLKFLLNPLIDGVRYVDVVRRFIENDEPYCLGCGKLLEAEYRLDDDEEPQLIGMSCQSVGCSI
jgi:hypothetical protein